MTLTLLIDLDDTLLGNEMGTFIPAYLRALSECLAPYAAADTLIPALLTATRQMIHNRQPDCTLREVFESAFYPALNPQSEEVIQGIQEAIEVFYRDIFPSLRPLTQFHPQAREMVDEGLARGFRLAITTNPLFPLAAIRQRLEWAGVPPDKYPFQLICSYETFHFAKPSPVFYAEVLARLGWPEGPMVMVGDDPANDIEAARRAGLAAYQITTSEANTFKGPYGASGAGTLEGFFDWLDTLSPAALEPDFTTPEAIVSILRSTPATLDSFAGRHSSQGTSRPPGPFAPPSSPAAWAVRPTEGAWSVTEIVCHLRDVDAEVNLPRIKNVLQAKNPFLVGINTDLWAEERQYVRQNGMEALHDFTQHRLELLAILENLSPEDWMQPARHAIFGPSHLRELIGIIASHDRLHIRQARDNLAKLNAPLAYSPY